MDTTTHATPGDSVPDPAEEQRCAGEAGGLIIQSAFLSDPARCESCGTLVGPVLSSPIVGPGNWQPTTWEVPQGYGTDQALRPGLAWRRHTPRRCKWMQDRTLAAVAAQLAALPERR